MDDVASCWSSSPLLSGGGPGVFLLNSSSSWYLQGGCRCSYNMGSRSCTVGIFVQCANQIFTSIRPGIRTFLTLLFVLISSFCCGGLSCTSLCGLDFSLRQATACFKSLHPSMGELLLDLDCKNSLHSSSVFKFHCCVTEALDAQEQISV